MFANTYRGRKLNGATLILQPVRGQYLIVYDPANSLTQFMPAILREMKHAMDWEKGRITHGTNSMPPEVYWNDEQEIRARSFEMEYMRRRGWAPPLTRK